MFYISEWYSLIDTLGCSHFSMKGPFDSLVCHSINFLRCPSSCAAATLVSGQRRSWRKFSDKPQGQNVTCIVWPHFVSVVLEGIYVFSSLRVVWVPLAFIVNWRWFLFVGASFEATVVSGHSLGGNWFFSHFFGRRFPLEFRPSKCHSTLCPTGKGTK